MTSNNKIISDIKPNNAKSNTLANNNNSEISPYLAMMERCIEQGNIDQIGKLMDYQDRWEAKLAKSDFLAALSTFQSVCPEIPKTKQAYNYKYAPIEDIVDFIKSPLSDCGLSYQWSTEQTDKTIKVTCIISHVNGHQETNTLIAPPDPNQKNVVMANMSTLTYLKRYSLLNGLGISTADEDKEDRIDPGLTKGHDWALEIDNCENVQELMVIYRKAQQTDAFEENKALFTKKRKEFEASKKGAKK